MSASVNAMNFAYQNKIFQYHMLEKDPSDRFFNAAVSEFEFLIPTRKKISFGATE